MKVFVFAEPELFLKPTTEVQRHLDFINIRTDLEL